MQESVLIESSGGGKRCHSSLCQSHSLLIGRNLTGEKLNQSGVHVELYDFSFQGQNISFFTYCTVGHKELM